MDAPPVTTLLLEGWIWTGLSSDTSSLTSLCRVVRLTPTPTQRKGEKQMPRIHRPKNNEKFNMTASGSEERQEKGVGTEDSGQRHGPQDLPFQLFTPARS